LGGMKRVTSGKPNGQWKEETCKKGTSHGKSNGTELPLSLKGGERKGRKRA